MFLSLIVCVYYIHCSYDVDMNGRMKRLSDENNHHNKEKEEKNRTNISAYGSIFTLYSVYIVCVHSAGKKRDCDEGKEEMKNKNNNTKTETYTQIRLLNDD